MIDLSTAEKRAALAPRGAPYFVKIAPGRHLGFRRGPQTWIAREHKPGAKRRFYNIGSEADYDHGAALAKALEWLDSSGDLTALPDSKLTIRLACSRYLTWRHNEKSFEAYKSTKSAFDTHIFKHRIADKLVVKATTADYQNWLNETGAKLVRNHRDPDPDEARRKGRYNANLCWDHFKAALNHARLTTKSLPAAEWSGRAVKTLEGGETGSRHVFLSESESQR